MKRARTERCRDCNRRMPTAITKGAPAVADGWSGCADAATDQGCQRAPHDVVLRTLRKSLYTPLFVPHSGAHSHLYGGARGTIEDVHQIVDMTRDNVRVRTRASRNMKSSTHPNVQRVSPDGRAFQASANAPAVKHVVENRKGISFCGNTCPSDPPLRSGLSLRFEDVLVGIADTKVGRSRSLIYPARTLARPPGHAPSILLDPANRCASSSFLLLRRRSGSTAAEAAQDHTCQRSWHGSQQESAPTADSAPTRLPNASE